MRWTLQVYFLVSLFNHHSVLIGKKNVHSSSVWSGHVLTGTWWEELCHVIPAGWWSPTLWTRCL